MEMLTGFPPVSREGCRTLILGSMPSVKSLERREYYAHPRNAFWPIMCALLAGEYISDYSARCQMLLDNGIALWDVCKCCRRESSADANIRDAEPNDIGALIDRTGVERVLINGGTAFALYRRWIKRDDIPCVRLPSTSPAYVLSYEKKLAAWQSALFENT